MGIKMEMAGLEHNGRIFFFIFIFFLFFPWEIIVALVFNMPSRPPPCWLHSSSRTWDPGCTGLTILQCSMHLRFEEY